MLQAAPGQPFGHGLAMLSSTFGINSNEPSFMQLAPTANKRKNCIFLKICIKLKLFIAPFAHFHEPLTCFRCYAALLIIQLNRFFLK